MRQMYLIASILASQSGAQPYWFALYQGRAGKGWLVTSQIVVRRPCAGEYAAMQVFRLSFLLSCFLTRKRRSRKVSSSFPRSNRCGKQRRPCAGEYAAMQVFRLSFLLSFFLTRKRRSRKVSSSFPRSNRCRKQRKCCQNWVDSQKNGSLPGKVDDYFSVEVG